MAYDVNKLAKLGHVQSLATRVRTALDAIQLDLNNAIQAVAVSGNTVQFFRDTVTTGTPAFSVDFPTEMFLDQATTAFVGAFHFDAATYPGATNPNLEGKPVLVLGVKTQETESGTVTETINYSFLDVSQLVDTYTSGNTAATISGYVVTINVPQNLTNGNGANALSITANGLEVDISGKADKVASATAGNVAGLDANGNLTDSGLAASEILVDSDVATDAECAEMIRTVFNDPAPEP